MDDFKNTREIMRKLFVKKTTESINKIIEETKDVMISDSEYNLNPDIVIASVQSSFYTNTISETEYKYFVNVLNSIKDIRLNLKNEPELIIKKRFKDLELFMN